MTPVGLQPQKCTGCGETKLKMDFSPLNKKCRLCVKKQANSRKVKDVLPVGRAYAGKMRWAVHVAENGKPREGDME